MATITVSFEDANGSTFYQHSLSDASLDRIIDAHRTIYPNADGTRNSKNGAKKAMVRATVGEWKSATKAFELALTPIPEIPTNEI